MLKYILKRKIGLSEKSEKYLIDISSGTIVIGADAVDIHIESGGHPTDLVPMNDYLTDREPVINNEPLDVDGWNLDDYRIYGKWLNTLINMGADTSVRLNQNVLRRGYAIGIGPSFHRLLAKSRFGSTSRFYEQIGASNTHRLGNFNNVSSEELVAWINTVAAILKRPPYAKDIDAFAEADPSRPKSSLYYRRFGVGGWSKACELAGYVVVDSWEEQDYYDWGVKVIEANDGLVPSARHIRRMSKKKLGPSDRSIILKFGSLKNYQLDIVERYRAKKDAEAEQKKELLDTIADKIESGVIPYELFLDCADEEEMITRYSKYLVVDELSSWWSQEKKIKIASDAYPDLTFNGAIRKSNDAITVGDIESTASYLGVFDNIWSIDTLSGKLKLTEEEIIGSRRGGASEHAWTRIKAA